MAWQVGTSLLIFRPNLRNVILVCKKRNCAIHNVCITTNHVVKIVNLLINHGGVTATDAVCQVFSFSATLLFYCVHCLQGCTAQTHMGPIWGVVLWFSQWPAVLRPTTLWSTPPSKNPP